MRKDLVFLKGPLLWFMIRGQCIYILIFLNYIYLAISLEMIRNNLFTVNMISLQQIKSLIHSYLQKRISTRILDIVLCVSRLINAIANSALYILKQNIKKLQYPAVAPLLPKKMLCSSTRENSRYVFSEKTEEICKLKVNMFSV